MVRHIFKKLFCPYYKNGKCPLLGERENKKENMKESKDDKDQVLLDFEILEEWLNGEMRGDD